MAGPKLKDLTGEKFNNFTVLKLSVTQPSKSNKYWDCVCICGNKRSVSRGNLGKVKGCGCVRKEYESTGKYTGQKRPKVKVQADKGGNVDFVLTSAKARAANKLKVITVSEEQANRLLTRRRIEEIQEQRAVNDYFAL